MHARPLLRLLHHHRRLQVFNELNARRIGSELNVFDGLLANPVFVSVLAFTVAAQYGLVTYGGAWVRTVPLAPDAWVKSALLVRVGLPDCSKVPYRIALHCTVP